MPTSSRQQLHQQWRDKVAEKTKKAKPFKKSASTEQKYARELRKIAREVGRIITGFPAEKAEYLPQIKQSLESYALIIRPWAKERATEMLRSVEHQDRRAWERASKEMNISIRHVLNITPIGQILKERLAEQVTLITSLPIEAAERVHKLTLEGIANSVRAPEIAKEIMRSGEVTEARANTIARTEVSRTSTILTQARAEYIGSNGYIWRTAHDSTVRESHRAMAGKFVAWNDPPTLDGLTGHAGALPNCRCYPEPVIPETIE